MHVWRSEPEHLNVGVEINSRALECRHGRNRIVKPKTERPLLSSVSRHSEDSNELKLDLLVSVYIEYGPGKLGCGSNNT